LATSGGSPADYNLCELRLSSSRMTPYLAAAGGDKQRAIRLYEWNVDVSGALYESLAVVEVVVRNAIHDQMTAWHDEQQLAGCWLDDPNNLLEPRAQDDIQTAKGRAARVQRGGRRSVSPAVPPPVGAVVAELTFGFWRYLLASRYEHTLWLHAVRHGFPQIAGMRERIYRPMSRLHTVRNRIAHLEPIHSRDLILEDRDIDQVIRAVCPKTATWAASRRRLKTLATTRP
jgi:hypothetical protein